MQFFEVSENIFSENIWKLIYEIRIIIFNNRSWFTKKKTLRIIDSETFHNQLFLFCFNPFAYYRYIIIMSKSDDCPNKTSMPLIFIDSSNITHIDFDKIRFQIEHPRKIGISGSEIIYSDRKS